MHDQVLALFTRHLGPLKPRGQGNYQTICPFHKDGQERTPSFSVNADKGVWHCFTCHEAGSVKSLLYKLGLSRAQVDVETRPIDAFLQQNREHWKLERQHTFVQKDPFRAPYQLPEVVLSLFDHEPTSLIWDGFDRGVLRDLEVGFDPRQRRITYPLRDLYGSLAGVAGGAIEQGVQPKYLVYEGGHRTPDRRWVPGHFGPGFDEEFPGYHCDNHDFIWNYDRIYARALAMSDQEHTVYLVEGYKACVWMHMAGFRNTGALMGSYISDTQQRLIHRLGGTVVLFLDNDEPGRRATLNVGELLWKPLHGRVMIIPYPEADRNDNTQPDDYELDAVRSLEEKKVPFTEYFQNRFIRRSNRW